MGSEQKFQAELILFVPELLPSCGAEGQLPDRLQEAGPAAGSDGSGAEAEQDQLFSFRVFSLKEQQIEWKHQTECFLIRSDSDAAVSEAFTRL